jgi:hypothetical protein
MIHVAAVFQMEYFFTCPYCWQRISMVLDMTSTASPESSEGGFLRILRGAALVAVLAGAGGSLALMLHAGRHQNSLILLLLFAVWVLSPFIAAVFASSVSERWSVLTRATLSVVMLVLTLGSLILYGEVAFGNLKVKIGFVFLVVPMASWLLAAIVVPIAAFISGRLSRRGEGT